jgi:hypothetical protein
VLKNGLRIHVLPYRSVDFALEAFVGDQVNGSLELTASACCKVVDMPSLLFERTIVPRKPSL